MGSRIPGARLPEGVDEDVLLAAGADGAAAFAFALVGAVDLVLRALGHGEEVVRGGEVAAERGAHELASHAVEFVDAVADGPDAHVDAAARADGGVGEGEEFAGPVPFFERGGEGGLVRGFFGGGEGGATRGGGYDLIEAEADDLAVRREGTVWCGTGAGLAEGRAASGGVRVSAMD